MARENNVVDIRETRNTSRLPPPGGRDARNEDFYNEFKNHVERFHGHRIRGFTRYYNETADFTRIIIWTDSKQQKKLYESEETYETGGGPIIKERESFFEAGVESPFSIWETTYTYNPVTGKIETEDRKQIK